MLTPKHSVLIRRDEWDFGTGISQSEFTVSILPFKDTDIKQWTAPTLWDAVSKAMCAILSKP